VVAVKWPAEVTGTLDAHFGDKQGLEDQHVNAGCPLFVPAVRDTISTLTARGPYSLGIPEVDGGQIIPTTISALTASMGVGSYLGHNKDDKVIVQPVAHTLKGEGFDASEDGTGRGTPLVHALTTATDPNSHVLMQPVAVPLQEVGKRTGVSTDDPRAGIGIGQDGDPMFTLQAGAQHGVAHAVGVQASQSGVRLNDTAGTLDANYGPRRHNGVMVPVAQAVSLRGRDGGGTAELGGDIQNALRASQGGGDKPHVLAAIGWDEELNASVEQAGTLLRGGDGGRHDGVMQPNMAVRRLTPVECERLQGFPDGYTNIPWRGKPEAPDGPRYKALGNSMAVPVMRWIGKRIANALA